MDKWMFVICMIIQGFTIRLQFIVYTGFDLSIDINQIDKKRSFSVQNYISLRLMHILRR